MNQNEFLNFISRSVDIGSQDCFENYKEREIVHLLKISDEDTRQCFYPSTPADAHGFSSDILDCFAELEIKYACYGLSLTTAYGFCNAVQNCSYQLIGNWFKAHSDLGADFLSAYLKQNQKEPAGTEFQNELFHALTSTAFMTGEWIRNVNVSQDHAKLLLAAVKRYMPQKYDDVIHAWAEYFPAETLQQLQQYDWFGKYESIDTLYQYYLKSSICSAVELQSNIKDYETTGRTFWSGVGCNGDIEYITHHEYDCGAAVAEWLNSGKPAKYGLRSCANPSNHIEEQKSRWVHTPSGAGCVSPDTRILMADGSEKKIGKMQPGDKVLSEGETVSVCSDELVYNDAIAGMYGFNEWQPFLSFEHAVMTQRGWCSLNPALSNEINPYFHVKMLEVGDKVEMLSRTQEGGFFTVHIPIKNINVKLAEEGSYFEGYDLHFREGKNSYYANGFLCLLNYPEITIKRIMDNLCRLPEECQTRFLQITEENRVLFEKVFGKTPVNQFIREVKNARLQNTEYS